MLVSLIVPILVSAVALFFASFVFWMILPIHKQDWLGIEDEAGFLDVAKKLGLQQGSYMFPYAATPEEMKSEEYQNKWNEGPCGILTVFPTVSMGKNLGLTFVYFLGCCFCLGYLSTLALDPGEGFMDVFRFYATAGLMTFLPAILQHAIWFHNRVIGHVIESVVYSVIVGLVFALMWPG